MIITTIKWNISDGRHENLGSEEKLTARYIQLSPTHKLFSNHCFCLINGQTGWTSPFKLVAIEENTSSNRTLFL